MLLAAGLESDCPFKSAEESSGSDAEILTAESVEAVDEASFMSYTARINTYLQVHHHP